MATEVMMDAGWRLAHAVPSRCAGRAGGMCGMSMVEMLVVLPALLLMALAVVQCVLVFQAHNALDYALNEAARAGAVDHASETAIVRGLGAGLAPWLYGADRMEEKMLNEGRGMAHVVSGRVQGWIQLAQRSPTLESFRDWAEPALDSHGEEMRGTDEIPNDNLDNRRLKAQPRSGVAGVVNGEPIGQASGQTLADANLLRLELQYGVRLGVPLVGKLALKTLMTLKGCNGLGSLVGSVGESGDGCSFYRRGRIPVSVVATVRMMSPARRSSLLQAALPGQGRRAASSGSARMSEPSAQTEGNGGSGSTLGAGGGQEPATGDSVDEADETGADDGDTGEEVAPEEQAEGKAEEADDAAAAGEADDEGLAHDDAGQSAAENGSTAGEQSVPPGGGSLLDRLIPDRQPHPEICLVPEEG